MLRIQYHLQLKHMRNLFERKIQSASAKNSVRTESWTYGKQLEYYITKSLLTPEKV